MNQTVRLAVIGCGAAAADLCRAAGQVGDVRVATAFDVDATRADCVAALTGARVAASLDDALTGGDVDAAYVALPHRLLAPAVERAIEAGLHTLAEKPLALDAATAQGLGALAERAGVRLGVNLVLRQAAAVRWAREVIGGGRIGDVQAVRIRCVIDKPDSYWSVRWRAVRADAGGGVVLMNAIHLLDVVSHVTGTAFVRASADVATFSPRVDVDDVAGAVLRLSGGAVVTLTASARSRGAVGEELVSIDGSTGRIDLPYLLGADPPALHVGAWTRPELEPRDCFAETLRAFITAVQTGAPPSPGAADATAALATVSAIYASAATGRAVGVSA